MKHLIFILFFISCATTDLTRITSFEYSQSVQGDEYVIDIEATFENVKSITVYVYRFENTYNKFYGPLAAQEYILMRGHLLKEQIYTNRPGLYLVVFEAAGKEIGRKEITVVEVT